MSFRVQFFFKLTHTAVQMYVLVVKNRFVVKLYETTQSLMADL